MGAHVECLQHALAKFHDAPNVFRKITCLEKTDLEKTDLEKNNRIMGNKPDLGNIGYTGRTGLSRISKKPKKKITESATVLQI